jgi:hypothetical protein
MNTMNSITVLVSIGILVLACTTTFPRWAVIALAIIVLMSDIRDLINDR